MSDTPPRDAELVALLNKISEESVTTSNVLADMLDLLRERLPGRAEVKVAPFDPDLAARNLDAIKHELETPMREHGECCAPVPRTEPKGAPAASAPLRPGEYILNRDGSAYRVVGTSEPGGDDEAQEDPDGALAKAEAERDDWKADAVARKRVVDNRGEQIASLTERNVDLTAERDGWKAKHAALRAAVQVTLAHAEPDSWADLRLRRILDRDDARDPQAD